jgi:GT2 family glycosyltransferase
MKLSIVILTWNSKDMLLRCLQSIYDNTDVDDYEIIVIDNGSRDCTQELLDTKFPEVKVIRNKINIGVAPARNQGLKLAIGEYILILDVDTIAKRRSIDTLVDFMEMSNGVGLVGPKLIYSDGKLQYSCRKFPTILSKVFRRMPFRFGQHFLKVEEYRDWDHCSIRDVDYVIGACQLIRKNVLEEIGYLDDKMFYGPEDVDFCLRLRKANWKVIYNPEAEVIHDELRITRKKVFSKITWKHVVALIRYFKKHKYYLSRKRLYDRLENHKQHYDVRF